MADNNNSNIFDKILKAGETALDTYISKAKTATEEEAAWSRKGLTEVEYATEQQAGWKEKKGLIGTGVLKNMARKDSVVMAIINTRMNQVNSFVKPQKDKYSPGYKIVPKQHADYTTEEKLSLGDPNLSDKARAELQYKAEQKRAKSSDKQLEEIKKIETFLTYCGSPSDETDTTHKRIDFDKCIKLLTWDRLVYNYTALELIPTKDGSRLSRFYPVSAGTIRYVSNKSAGLYQSNIKTIMDMRVKDDASNSNNPNSVQAEEPKPVYNDKDNPFKYVQVLRGRVVAAWSEKEMIFEPANPTTDPEDYGYGTGELELLIQVITAHLFAEAHNRNFFTQGIGSKGLLHIKGDSINRAQLEAFKRQWFNQLSNSKNAFRPPIIGMADDVKWIPLSQTNREMEFEQWMHYLIKIACAVYQIDPAEINFDISKLQTSTLNEANNEQRIKQSRDKGLGPLLDYLENIINRHILPYWDKDLADRYAFRFVGLDSETRMQEVTRLKEETAVWKTINEARIEMSKHPMEDMDIIRDPSFMQLKQAKMQQAQEAAQAGQEGEGGPDEGEEPGADLDNDEPVMKDELNDLNKDMDQIEKDVAAQSKQDEQDAKDAEAQDQKDAEADSGKPKASSREEKQEKAVKASVKSKGQAKKSKEAVAKSGPDIIEYYTASEDEE